MAPDLFALVPSVAQAEFGHLDCMQLVLSTTVHHCGYRSKADDERSLLAEGGSEARHGLGQT